MNLRALIAAGLVCLTFGPAQAWEVVIAFTSDLHASLPRLSALEPWLADADLVLDAGDAWEDLWRLTGFPQALATARRMGELGYQAMVLGNHEMYLGPALREVILAAPFPVVGTNLSGDLPVERWTVLEAGGVRVLILGLLWEEYPWSLWPGVRLEEPVGAVRKALAHAPAHDLVILLGHMELGEARRVAQGVPECDLFVLGHDHLWLEAPLWVEGVPIVQAGHRAGGLGLVRLSPQGLEYQLVRLERKPLPGFWLPALAALLALLLAPAP
jgi:2',3'-cyclic-nucleotide 2'-phosphodiesterase (5'-nucleotidase family)